MTTQTQYPSNDLLLASQQALPHTATVTESDIGFLFLHILRDPTILAEAKSMLRVEHFERSTESHFALLWASIAHLHDRYGCFNNELLQNDIYCRVAGDSESVPPHLVEYLVRQAPGGFLYACSTTPPHDLSATRAREIMRQFLEERGVMAPLRRLIASGTDNTRPRDFRELVLSSTAQFRRIDSVREVPRVSLTPAFGSALPPPAVYRPTTLGFIDNYIKGQRPGDCNGILGVYGGGKTTLGTQIALANAKNFHSAQLAVGEKRKLSVFVSYEEPAAKMQPRIWASAASIKRSKLEALGEAGWESLSRPGHLEPYELELARGTEAASGGTMPSERCRWESTRKWLDRSFVLIDLSGSDKYPGYGKGFVDEMKGILDRLRQQHDADIGTVTIDYAGLMCQRYIDANSLKQHHLRIYLGGLADKLRQEIAEPLKATVWLLHQLSTDAQKRSPTHLMHHSEAADARNFAEHMAVCGCLGVADNKSGCLLLNWSKIRYFRDLSRTPPILRIDGNFCRMVDVSPQFVADRAVHGIVDADWFRSVVSST